MEEKSQKGREGNKDIVLEKSSEVYQMYVGHRQVKVWMRSCLKHLLNANVFQVHPLVTPQLRVESNYKVKEALVLGKIDTFPDLRHDFCSPGRRYVSVVVGFVASIYWVFGMLFYHDIIVTY